MYTRQDLLRCLEAMDINPRGVLLVHSSMKAIGEVISTYVYKMGLGSGASNDYSYSTAVDMFNSIVNLIMITSANYISRTVGETSLW